jgi:hypothetical protein
MSLLMDYGMLPHPTHFSATFQTPPEPSNRLPERAATPIENERPEYSDYAQIKAQVNTFIKAIRPKIKEFLTNQRLPVWPSPESADEETQKFYRDLEIPSLNGKPSLQLHGLGTLVNPHAEGLFSSKCKFDNPYKIICNTSGSGKTRLLFEGLCRRWGFYFVVAQGKDGIGATDLENAIASMKDSKDWVDNIFQYDDRIKVGIANESNEGIANRNISKVFSARWIVFDTFIRVAKKLNGGTLPDNIRRDWLLFQILPIGQEIFLDAVSSLVGVRPGLFETLSKIFSFKVLGSDFNPDIDSFFYVIDDAQVARDIYTEAFSDPGGMIKCPVLRPIILHAVASSETTAGIIKVILSGTGFSLRSIKTIMEANVGGDSSIWDFEHATGDFSDQDTQLAYISRYLPPPFLLSDSGTHLQTRIYKWLCGRYVVTKVLERGSSTTLHRHGFTARYLEELLTRPWQGDCPASPHKLLNAHVQRYADFMPLDVDHAILEKEADVGPVDIDGFQWNKIKNGKSH